MQLSQTDLQNLSQESLSTLRRTLNLASENLDRLSSSSRNELQELEDQLTAENDRRFWLR